jgi:hypothetical protein
VKISIALALLILALGLPLAWRDHQQLAGLRESHHHLLSQVAQSGISPRSSRQLGDRRTTRPSRENGEGVARKLAADLISTAGTGDTLDDLLVGVTSLDATQLKILFADILTNKNLTATARRKLLFSLAEVTSDQPQVALAMLTESINFTQERDLTKDLVSASLAKWAKQDPAAVLAWVQKNGELFSQSVDENNKVRIIGSAAVHHPALALRLVGQIGLDPTKIDIAFVEIAQAAQTPADRTTTLKAVATYLASLPAGEVKDRASQTLISNLIKGAAREGFDTATQWLDQSGMTAEQREFLPRSYLFSDIKLDETGRWVEWMGRTQAGEQTEWCNKELIRLWTERDPQAAGKWLASTPAGPIKNAAIHRFVESVAQYDPEMAEQWAMTLPSGADRGEALKRVHENWPKDDEAAKQAFAKKHDLP